MLHLLCRVTAIVTERNPHSKSRDLFSRSGEAVAASTVFVIRVPLVFRKPPHPRRQVAGYSPPLQDPMNRPGAMRVRRGGIAVHATNSDLGTAQPTREQEVMTIRRLVRSRARDGSNLPRRREGQQASIVSPLSVPFRCRGNYGS